jgi:hypothetical protein
VNGMAAAHPIRVRAAFSCPFQDNFTTHSGDPARIPEDIRRRPAANDGEGIRAGAA